MKWSKRKKSLVMLLVILLNFGFNNTNYIYSKEENNTYIERKDSKEIFGKDIDSDTNEEFLDDAGSIENKIDETESIIENEILTNEEEGNKDGELPLEVINSVEDLDDIDDKDIGDNFNEKEEKIIIEDYKNLLNDSRNLDVDMVGASTIKYQKDKDENKMHFYQPENMLIIDDYRSNVRFNNEEKPYDFGDSFYKVITLKNNGEGKNGTVQNASIENLKNVRTKSKFRDNHFVHTIIFQNKRENKEKDSDLTKTEMKFTYKYANVGKHDGRDIYALANFYITPSNNFSSGLNTYYPVVQISESLESGWAWQNVDQIKIDLEFKYKDDNSLVKFSGKEFYPEDFSNIYPDNEYKSDYITINSLDPEKLSSNMGPEYVIPNMEGYKAYVTKDSNIVTSYNNGKEIKKAYNGGKNKWAWNSTGFEYYKNSVTILPKKGDDKVSIILGTIKRHDSNKTNYVWASISSIPIGGLREPYFNMNINHKWIVNDGQELTEAEKNLRKSLVNIPDNPKIKAKITKLIREENLLNENKIIEDGRYKYLNFGEVDLGSIDKLENKSEKFRALSVFDNGTKPITYRIFIDSEKSDKYYKYMDENINLIKTFQWSEADENSYVDDNKNENIDKLIDTILEEGRIPDANRIVLEDGEVDINLESEVYISEVKTRIKWLYNGKEISHNSESTLPTIKAKFKIEEVGGEAKSIDLEFNKENQWKNTNYYILPLDKPVKYQLDLDTALPYGIKNLTSDEDIKAALSVKEKKYDSDELILTLNIVQSLPHTGGQGKIYYIISGILLLSLSFILLYNRKLWRKI